MGIKAQIADELEPLVLASELTAQELEKLRLLAYAAATLLRMAEEQS